MHKSELTSDPDLSIPTIPVICDRCRAEGFAGDGPFAAIRDLLTFDPVPRRAHVNNWTAEHQRAFIAALAMTGSPRQAARALGRHAFGAEQLKSAKGGRGFAQAWDAALELYREREQFRIRDNLAGLAQQQEQRDEASLAQSHLRALPPPSPSPLEGEGGAHASAWEGEGCADQESPALLDSILHNYFVKLDAERRARLSGDVVAADFYLRQLTWIEVALDIAAAGGALAAFQDLRLKSADGHWDCGLISVAETDASRYLDQARRIFWENAGEPQRPPPPPEETFEEHAMIAPDGRRELAIRTQPSAMQGGPDFEDRWRKREEDQRRWAEEQVVWERAAYAAWLASTEAKTNDGGADASA